MKKLSADGLTRLILEELLSGLKIVGVLMENRGIAYNLSEIEKERYGESRKDRVNQILRRLEGQEYVGWRKENGEMVLKLEDKGKKKVQAYKLSKLKLKKPKNWDGLFRVIIFDIPENKKIARENLRKKLKELDFYQLQKSVFVSPYECKDEIETLSEIYEIEKHVQYLLVKEIPGLNPHLWFR